MIRAWIHARARPRPIAWLRRRRLARSLSRQVFTCGCCFAISRGRPPHGWHGGCPIAIENGITYRAHTDAERMAFIRQGQRDTEIGRANRLWAQQYEDDD